MIHFAIWQLNIAAVSVILYAGRVGHAVCSRKETGLLIYIAYGVVRLISFSLILGEESDIAFDTCRVL